MTDTLFDLPPGGVVRKAARRHVLLPSMGFACGRVMLDADCLDDPWVMSANDWCWVTCPDCLAVGRREVRRITHRQQKPEQHVCDDTCTWTSEPAESPAGAA